MGTNFHQAMNSGDGQNQRRGGNRTQPIPIQTKEYTTGAHLHMLTQVIDLLCHNLRAPSFDDQGAPVRQDMGGEVKLALESTVIKTCYAIDRIVEETSRFDVTNSINAENKVTEMLQANVNFVNAQTKAAKHILRPCVRFQPKLVKLTDGTFACFLGDLSTGHAIVGQGATPEAALEAFDQVFEGKTPKEMIQWIEQKTSNARYPAPEINDETELDGERIGTDEEPAKPGKDGPGNCLGPAANPGVSGKKARKNKRASKKWSKGSLFGPDGSELKPPKGDGPYPPDGDYGDGDNAS
jgi:hypothetical protein